MTLGEMGAAVVRRFTWIREAIGQLGPRWLALTTLFSATACVGHRLGSDLLRASPAHEVISTISLWSAAGLPTLGAVLSLRNHPRLTFDRRGYELFGWWAGLTVFSAIWLHGFWKARVTFAAQPGTWITLAVMATGASVLSAVAMRLQAWESNPAPKVSETSFPDLESVMAEEADWIRRRRGVAKEAAAPLSNLLGLALSGGGIRSATTCLGFLQGLARAQGAAGKTALSFFDYLSTVSGGGWLGGALTARLGGDGEPRAPGPGRPKTAFDPARDESWEDLATELRRRGDYLLPGGPSFGPTTVRPLILLLWGAVINSAAAVFFACSAAILASNQHDAPATGLELPLRRVVAKLSLAGLRGLFIGADHPLADRLSSLNVVPLALLAAALVLAVGLLIHLAGVMALMRRARLFGSSLAAKALLAVFALGLLTLALHGREELTLLAFGGALAVIAILLARQRSRRQLAAIGSGAAALGGVALKGLGAVTTLLATLTGAWFKALVAVLLFPIELGDALSKAIGIEGHAANSLVAGAAGFLVLLFGFMASRNTTSLHEFWENQIYCAYLSTGAYDQLAATREPANWPLSALRPVKDVTPRKKRDPSAPRNFGGPNLGAPLHVITAAINLPGSTDDTLKKRGTDRFELSPYAVGSRATGFARTELYDDAVTLRSAIATSAAAVNSEGGNAIPRWARAGLDLLNLGLGSWFRNPRMARQGDPRFRRWGHFWSWYGLSDLLGVNDETESLVMISDGGHHDNLGLTALVERACSIVVCIDAGSDFDVTCSDLARAAMLLRLDQSWTLDLSREHLEDLRPARPGGSYAERMPKSSVAAGTFSRRRELDDGRIDEQKVKVFYVKAGLVPGLPLEVQRYAEDHPDFPHESTADQFFSEEQFEAYRLLGRALAGRLTDLLERDPDWSAVVKGQPQSRPTSAAEHPDHAEHAEDQHPQGDHGDRAVGDAPAA